MTWRKKWTLTIFAVGAVFYLAWWADANAQLPPMPNSQVLELTPTPKENLRIVSGPPLGMVPYRCEMAKDRTTITLKPIDKPDGTGFIFKCVNCECGEEK